MSSPMMNRMLGLSAAYDEMAANISVVATTNAVRSELQTPPSLIFYLLSCLRHPSVPLLLERQDPRLGRTFSMYCTKVPFSLLLMSEGLRKVCVSTSQHAH